jgi:serine protease Do
MRKAFVAGLTGVAVVVVAFVMATAVRSQSPSPAEAKRDRRVLMLDGRGSSIGVSIRDVETEDASKAKLERAGGALIERVDEESPAAKAGLREGDVVVEFDGERVRSARHFARLVQDTPSGRSVAATVVREGARQTVNVTPAADGGRWAGELMHLPELADGIQREVERGMRALPKDFAFDFTWEGGFPHEWEGALAPGMAFPRGRLGARLSPLSDQLAEYFGAKGGVLVSSVDAESVGAKAGLKAGDVITAINGSSVRSPRDVAEELREVDPGSEVTLDVLRDKKPLTLKARTPERKRPAVARPVRPA